MQAASTSPARQRSGRVSLAADVVTVEADADVEAPHVDRRVADQRQREQGGLWRVDSSHAARWRLPADRTRWSTNHAGTTITDTRSWSVSRMTSDVAEGPFAGS